MRQKFPFVMALVALFVSVHVLVYASEPDFTVFARNMEQLMEKGDPSLFAESFDASAFTARAVSGYTVDASLMKVLVGSTKSEFEKNRLGMSVNWQMGDSGSFRFLRMRSGNRALFRLITKEGGIDYYEFVLAHKKGIITVDDIYIYSDGEYISDSMRRMLLPVIVETRKSIVGRLLGWEEDFMGCRADLQLMDDLARSGRIRESLEVYYLLPDMIKKDKSVMLRRVSRAYMLEDDSEYVKALEDFAKFFPDDPARDLLLIDYYALTGKHKETVLTINRLNKRVGEDPYLYYMRSNAYVSDGEYAKARESAEKAVKDAPWIEDAYWTLVTISLAEKNYNATVMALSVLEKNFSVAFDDLTKIKEYDGFVKSPEYAKWMKARK